MEIEKLKENETYRARERERELEKKRSERSERERETVSYDEREREITLHNAHFDSMLLLNEVERKSKQVCVCVRALASIEVNVS